MNIGTDNLRKWRAILSMVLDATGNAETRDDITDVLNELDDLIEGIPIEPVAGVLRAAA